MTEIEVRGRRVYFVGLPIERRDAAKTIGAHWDRESLQWWVGLGKRAEAERVCAEVNLAAVETTPASRALAPTVGLSPDAPAYMVRDALLEGGREAEADSVMLAGGEVVPDDARVYARVNLHGRSHLVIAETRDLTRCRICLPDGTHSRWVACAECELVRRYEPREYRGRTEYTTLGGLRRFAARQADPATRRGPCTECGHWGPAGEPCAECGGEGTHA